MKSKILFVMLTSILAFSSFACSNQNKKAENTEQETIINDTIHNSKNSLDYEGTYTGTMPCADCSEIYTEIVLDGDNYTMKTIYEGKDEKNNTFAKSGKYSWDKTGSVITLDSDTTNRYKVGENILFALDMDGKIITGDLADMYILKKK